MALSAGTRLGHYDVTALLGEGGMGQVYQAEELETGRRVVLKVLQADLADPKARCRFLREGRLAASISYPLSGGRTVSV